jgi:hypothetical protein
LGLPITKRGMTISFECRISGEKSRRLDIPNHASDSLSL